MIANVNHDMKVVKEEIFGPVVVVMKFKDEKEAIKLANDTEFGLGSAIWTKDGARAQRVAGPNTSRDCHGQLPILRDAWNTVWWL